jgi:hypothetical protein
MVRAEVTSTRITLFVARTAQWLNVSYSIWFNPNYQRVGPLFQGRFKAVLYEPCIQGLVINRYIHLNPVRISRLGGHEERSGQATNEPTAELARARVDALRNYPWSSYRSHVASAKKPEWLTTAAVLEFLGEGTPRKLGSSGSRRKGSRLKIQVIETYVNPASLCAAFCFALTNSLGPLPAIPSLAGCPDSSD